ncbi:MAG: 4Fe-4S binding protein [Ignavibacteriales bacterium]
MINREIIVELIEQFAVASPLNVVDGLRGMRIYDSPMVGFASADDPLFSQFRDPGVIGPHHLPPGEWLAEAATVISYFLPFSARVREANRGPGLPAVEWLYGRIEGEQFNNALRRHLCDEISKAGGQAVAPAIDPRFEIINERANWSERHAAFAAGLGTFCLSKSMITSKGSAGRFGSVVTTLQYEPTRRPYTGVYEYCTRCGACIDRCPVGAISTEGKEHRPCSHYINAEIKEHCAPRVGCGKCQTGVPCEGSIPRAAER